LHSAPAICDTLKSFFLLHLVEHEFRDFAEEDADGMTSERRLKVIFSVMNVAGTTWQFLRYDIWLERTLVC
jgi:hypothetical protein